jgi:hypothetical protein
MGWAAFIGLGLLCVGLLFWGSRVEARLADLEQADREARDLIYKIGRILEDQPCAVKRGERECGQMSNGSSTSRRGSAP